MLKSKTIKYRSVLLQDGTPGYRFEVPLPDPVKGEMVHVINIKKSAIEAKLKYGKME